MEELNTLKAVVIWILQTGGAAYIAFWLTERFAWPPNEELRRYVSFLIAAVVGLVAWAFGMEMGYLDKPVGDWRVWVDTAGGVVLVVIIAAQALHGRLVLSKKAE